MRKQVCFFEDVNSNHSQDNATDNCSYQASPKIEIEANKHDR